MTSRPTFGLTTQELELLESLLVLPLKQIGALVWVFGSRARGDHQKFSDLDIMYDIPNNVLLPQGLISRIKEALEESRLQVKVDLVKQTDLAQSYLEGALKDRIRL